MNFHLESLLILNKHSIQEELLETCFQRFGIEHVKNTLIAVVHSSHLFTPHMDMQIYPMFGTIVTHGCLDCGFL